MTFDITKYCYANHPREEIGNSFEYSHDGLNLMYVIGDKVSVFINDREIHLNEGEVLSVSLPCVVKNNGRGRVYAINLNGSLVDKYIKEVEGFELIPSIFIQMIPLLIHQIVEGYNNVAQSHIATVSFNILSVLSLNENKTSITNQTITEAIKLINENYSMTYGVEELSRALNISKSHLVREFCKYTGTTPGKYLNSVRIDAVKILLEQTSLSLEAIAKQTGFSGDNYLCKAFKKATGETPIEYKNKMMISQYLPNQISLKM